MSKAGWWWGMGWRWGARTPHATAQHGSVTAALGLAGLIVDPPA